MVSRTEIINNVELTADEAANIVMASNPLAPVFAKIREAARNGFFSITLGGMEVSQDGKAKLQELGYKVEGGRAIIITWNRW